MRSEHTSRQEVIRTVFEKLGPGKALDAGQRLLNVKKRTLTNWFEQWQQPRKSQGRNKPVKEAA